MKRIGGGSVAHSLGPFLQEAREGSEKGFLVSLQPITSERTLANFKRQSSVVRRSNRFCIPGLAWGSSEIMDGNGLDNCRGCGHV